MHLLFSYFCLLSIAGIHAIKLAIPRDDFLSAEKGVEKLRQIVQTFGEKYQDILKTAFGLGLIMSGGKLQNSMQFLHAFSSSMPSLTENFNDLKKSYLNTRTAFKEELPELKKSKADLDVMRKKVTNLKSDLVHLKSSFSNKEISRDSFETKYKVIETDIKQVTHQIKRINLAGNAISQIINAINPKHVKDVFKNIYATLILSITSVQNKGIGNINMGLNIGNILYERIEKIFQFHEPTWTSEFGSILSKAVSIILATKFKAEAPVLSACMLGSHIVTTVIEKWTEPIKIDLGTKSKVLGALQACLVGFGYNAHMSSSKVTSLSQMNSLLGVVMVPLQTLENLIMKVIVGKGI